MPVIQVPIPHVTGTWVIRSSQFNYCHPLSQKHCFIFRTLWEYKYYYCYNLETHQFKPCIWTLAALGSQINKLRNNFIRVIRSPANSVCALKWNCSYLNLFSYFYLFLLKESNLPVIHICSSSSSKCIILFVLLLINCTQWRIWWLKGFQYALQFQWP